MDKSKWYVGSYEELAFNGLTHSEYAVNVFELNPPRDDPNRRTSLSLAEAGAYINVLEDRIRKLGELFEEYAVTKSITLLDLNLEMREVEKIIKADTYKYLKQQELI